MEGKKLMGLNTKRESTGLVPNKIKKGLIEMRYPKKANGKKNRCGGIRQENNPGEEEQSRRRAIQDLSIWAEKRISFNTNL